MYVPIPLVLSLLGAAVAAAVVWVLLQHRRFAPQATDQRMLALVARLTPNAVMITDAQRRIAWTNEAFTRITGFRTDEAAGRRPGELLHHEREDAAARARLHESLDRGLPVRAQVLSTRKDGSDLWLDLDAQPLRDRKGRVTGFVCIATDVTERRLAQADLRIAAIAFDSLEAIAITDARQVILKVNPAFTRITGYTAEEAYGRVTGQLLRSGVHDGAFYAAMWDALHRSRHWQGEVWNRRKSGEVYPEWLSITAVVDDDDKVTNFVAAFSDITEKKRADEIVHRLAFHDALTELPNRRLLLDRLAQALAASARHGRHVAVLFMDLDRFKALNDTFGHESGDRLLVEVARRLKACVREEDTVSRQGGDEFVVLITNLSESFTAAQREAAIVANKIEAVIARPFDLGTVEWQCACSIGQAIGLGHQQGAEQLLKRADDDMYKIKHARRAAAGRGTLSPQPIDSSSERV